MSTKSKIRSGEGFYIYEELFESNKVYLELDEVEWLEVQSENKTRVCIRFDVKKAAELGIISDQQAQNILEQEPW